MSVRGRRHRSNLPKVMWQIRKPCSCYGCGNKRRHFGLPTMQEIRFFEGEHGDDEGARPLRGMRGTWY